MQGKGNEVMEMIQQPYERLHEFRWSDAEAENAQDQSFQGPEERPFAAPHSKQKPMQHRLNYPSRPPLSDGPAAVGRSARYFASASKESSSARYSKSICVSNSSSTTFTSEIAETESHSGIVLGLA